MPLFTDEDITFIPHPKPDTHYLWGPADPTELSDYLQSGYSLVTKQEAEEIYDSKDMASTLTDINGRIRRGDMILLKTSAARAAEIQAYMDRKHRDQEGRTRQSFHQAIDRIGHKAITSYEAPVGEMAEQRKFAQRESNNRVFVSRPAK